ncbi:hypothetical protein TPENAI_61244 [Tenacibaculum litopenaei]|uniref:hypothetical protein n=1 Tax=Tenacibaculum litopenaei TaxID=396016 RepID=UPI0038962987
MYFNKSLDYNSRIKIKYDTDNEKLIHDLNYYWKAKKRNNIPYSEVTPIKFNIGIENNNFIEIKSRKKLEEEKDKLLINIEKEFNLFQKSKNKKKLLDDVKLLFEYRREFEERCLEKIRKIANDEYELKQANKKTKPTEFNILLVIAELYTKDKIMGFLRAKGFEWESIKNLEKNGLIFVKYNFNNKRILEFIIVESLRERLNNYIAKEGIDVYSLETIY